ncbi:MAG: type II toxin-antitoxin system RelE/ParE family toxin [Firmicutes bacterium]|nr:type II toxin-antitoxin system RelE/ParE family toxin [Bacillota bacterium]
MRSLKSKDSRIQHKQVMQYIQLLEDHGTMLGENVTKHLEDKIWELRPGKNRILFFFDEDETFILLHHFRKKTQKTPRKEIEKAKNEMNDWIERKEADNE